MLNDLAKAGAKLDPMAQYKRPTVGDRQDDYRARARMMMISPARADPFAFGR